jgi:hypothetical protein
MISLRLAHLERSVSTCVLLGGFADSGGDYRKWEGAKWNIMIKLRLLLVV